MRLLTLFVVVDQPDFAVIWFGLGDGDRGRVGHRGHGCRWHHQCRHHVVIKQLGINFDSGGGEPV